MTDPALVHSLEKMARRVRLASPGADVPSPCMSICQMNVGDGLCQGCLRTLEEIAGWGAANPAQKRAIWHSIDRRLAHAPGQEESPS